MVASGKMGMGIRCYNGNEMGMGIGITSWEWEGMGTAKVIPAHL